MVVSLAKIKNVDKVEFNVRRALEKVLENRALQNEIGNYAVDQIQLQARIGKPMQGKQLGRFPSGYPAKATVEQRKKIAKFNSTHPTYGASNANLTITGQLIDAVKFKWGKERDGVNFVLSVDDNTRRPYRTGPNSKSKRLTNNVVYNFLLDLNRRFAFLGLDKKRRTVIKNKVRRNLRRALKLF